MTNLYRKRPVEIQAVQFGGSSTQLAAIRKWMDGGDYVPPAVCTCDFRSFNFFTPEGEAVAYPGDWVVKDADGEFYSYGPDAFAKTYERVEGRA